MPVSLIFLDSNYKEVVLSRANAKLLRQFNQELNTVVLVWLLMQDDKVLRHWKLDAPMLERLRNLSLQDLIISANPMVRVDQDCLRQTLRISEAFRAERLLIDRAISLDARHKLLHSYTGISYVEYSRRLKALNLKLVNGRIRVLSMEQIRMVSETWKDIGFRNREPLRALCVLSEKTSLPLSSIWVSFKPGALP
jgi:hypothetical protein